jgi:hypothetical protein
LTTHLNQGNKEAMSELIAQRRSGLTMKISCGALAILGCILCGSAYASTKPVAKHPAPVLALLTQSTAVGAAGAQSKPVISPRKPRPAISRRARPAPDSTDNSTRSNAPVVTVADVGPGQAGYVHYFLLKLPGGDEETLVGIELPDQRIAWSFPELGVVVSPFIGTGLVQAGGNQYEVQHLYGLRPFPDDESMRRLQAQLMTRVTLWVEDATPYCNLQGAPTDQFCLSCLGFALRVIFPGPTPEYPVVPRDFPRTSRDTYYTTEDLLLYLVGLHQLRGNAARLKRIDELALPESLREEAIRLVNAPTPKQAVAVADAAPTPSEKMRPGVQPPLKNGPERLPRRKRAS